MQRLREEKTKKLNNQEHSFQDSRQRAVEVTHNHTCAPRCNSLTDWCSNATGNYNYVGASRFISGSEVELTGNEENSVGAIWSKEVCPHHSAGVADQILR